MADEISIIDAPPPSAPPAPTKSILVSQMAQSVSTVEPKKGSAMDRMRESLRAKAKPEGIQAAPAPAAPAATPAAVTDPQPSPEGEPPTGAETDPEPSAVSAPSTTKPDKRPTAWQVANQYKELNIKLEKQIAELKGQITPENDRKSLTERAASIEKRNKELEDEIRYTNYAKSQEFKEKYQEPYESAWKRALTDLKEVTVNTGEGERAITANDLLDLVNMPLARAREIARNAFGESADEVMAHRREIKRLADEQDSALTKAKTDGAKREEERNQQMTAAQAKVAEEIKTTWEKVKTDLLEDKDYGTYFKPADGDEQGNQRLAKGFELVARAFSENPADPRLTPEQRAGIIKRHSAVYNRAAAFGRLVYQNKQKDTRIAELEKEVEQYKGSTPPAGGTGLPPAVSGGTSAWSSVRAGLAKLAK